MNRSRTYKLTGIAAALLVLAGCGGAQAQDEETEDFPNGTISIILPSAPGAPIDGLARELAPALEAELGESVVVENREGGSGIVALSYLNQQPADGHSISLEATGITSVLQVQDTDMTPEDFIPVARIELDPFALFVNADSEYETLDDFLAAAEASPGSLSVGGYGTGSPHHIRAAQLRDSAGVDFEWVPHDSGSDAMTGLLGNNLDAVLSNTSQIAQFGDEVRTLGHSSEEPLMNAPEAPSFADEGYDELTSYHWRGAFVKAGTPDPVVDKLNEALNEAIASDGFQEYLENVGNLDGSMSQDEFASLVDGQKEGDRDALESLGLLN